MSKGLKVLMAASIAAGCACLLGLAAVAGSADNSSAATDSVVTKSSQVKSATKAPNDDLAGRRYRRYWRRHTV